MENLYKKNEIHYVDYDLYPKVNLDNYKKDALLAFASHSTHLIPNFPEYLDGRQGYMIVRYLYYTYQTIVSQDKAVSRYYNADSKTWSSWKIIY